jgi:hypothetical protein
VVRCALGRRVALWVGEGGGGGILATGRVKQRPESQATTRDTFERSRVGLVELGKWIRRAMRSPRDPKIPPGPKTRSRGVEESKALSTDGESDESRRPWHLRPTESEESTSRGHEESGALSTDGESYESRRP